jgi:hypothetical protein
METALNLLTRECTLHFSFSPHLTAEQYAELMTLVERAASREELRRELKKAAKRWGAKVEIEK